MAFFCLYGIIYALLVKNETFYRKASQMQTKIGRFLPRQLIAAVLFVFVPCLNVQTNTSFAARNKDGDSNDVNHPAVATKEPNQAQPKISKDANIPRPTHQHAAFRQRKKERAKMVDRQSRSRDITEPNVLAALRTVPRHAFVRSDDLRRAYRDHPLPIGFGQTISQPYIVAYMTDALKLKPQFKVLEIGTGSGYQAAVCAEIVKAVYTIEIVEPLAESAKKRLENLGYRNVFVKAGDGFFGWHEQGPFDAIIVTCAAGFVPPPLAEQLKPTGQMILPLGSPYGSQILVLVTKDKKGDITSKRLLPVRFVPMLGEIGKTTRD